MNIKIFLTKYSSAVFLAVSVIIMLFSMSYYFSKHNSYNNKEYIKKVLYNSEKSDDIDKNIEKVIIIIKKTKNVDIKYRAMLTLAKLYYYKSDMDNSKRICNQLLSIIPISYDPRYSFETKILLLSIERKTSELKGE